MPPLLDASWSADTLISESNVVVTKNTCECGGSAYEVKATKPIPKGHPLMVELRTERPTQKTLLLAQFDGSCHDAATEDAAAGCGVVVWKIAPGQPPELVARLAIPLLEATTAPESEAAGAAHALLTLRTVAETMNEEYDVLIQGDNKAIMDFWNGDANLKQPRLHKLMGESFGVARFWFPKATWEHLPRECNQYADFLAGEASLVVKHIREGARDLRASSFSPSIPCLDKWDCHEVFQAYTLAITTPRNRCFTIIEDVPDFQKYAVAIRMVFPTIEPRALAKTLAIRYKFAEQGNRTITYTYRTTTPCDHQGRQYPEEWGAAS